MFDFRIYTFKGLAEFLGVSPKAMKFYAFSKHGQKKAYRTFPLNKKGGGTRPISAPHDGLYIIQRAILDKILTPENLQNRYCVFSYAKGKSAQEMSARHVSRDFIVRFDLEDFFGHLTFPRVLGALKAFPLKLPHHTAVVIAQLCTTSEGLPQGAPTSPALSNLIARRMDGEFIRLAKENGFRYSRYSDDLIISGTTKRNLSTLVEFDEHTKSYVAAEPVRQIIESNSFTLNASKTRLAFRHQKQVVVGSVVNKKVNVDRKYIRQIRTLLHLCRKDPDEALQAYRKWTGRDVKNISDVLRGKIGYARLLKGISDSVFITLERFPFIPVHIQRL